MSDLANKNCVPCNEDLPPMKKAEAEKYLEEIPEWSLAENGKKLNREFVFDSFKESIKFVNNVAKIAEAEGHHPDIAINYKKVKLELTTHNIRGLSENDFIMAAKIDSVL